MKCNGNKGKHFDLNERFMSISGVRHLVYEVLMIHGPQLRSVSAAIAKGSEIWKHQSTNHHILHELLSNTMSSIVATTPPVPQ